MRISPFFTLQVNFSEVLNDFELFPKGLFNLILLCIETIMDQPNQ